MMVDPSVRRLRVVGVGRAPPLAPVAPVLLYYTQSPAKGYRPPAELLAMRSGADLRVGSCIF